MRATALPCALILAASCAASQTPAGPSPAPAPTASASPSPAALTVMDAGPPAPAPNPRAAPRPSARLPDGGVNPEACVGVCSLVPHDAAAARAGDPVGTIDLPAVDRALRRDAVTLRGCYDRALSEHPWLANQTATITVDFIVEPTGRVRPMPLATGLPDAPSVATCLAMRLRYITFPTPTGGPAEVTLPFTFGGN